MLPFFAILVMWLGIGAMFTLALIASEMWAFRVRGPEYLHRTKDALTDAKPLSFRKMLILVALWPALFHLFYKAYRNKRFPLEQIEADRKEREDEVARKEQITRAKFQIMRKILAGEIPLDVKWFHSGGSKGEFHIRMAVYINPKDEVDPIPLATNFVVVTKPGVIRYYRGTPNDGDHAPWGVAKTIEDAIKACDADTHWHELCAPARSEERNRVLRDLIENGREP